MGTQPKNYIYSVFFLVLLVVVILLGLKSIEGEANKVDLKPVDMLSQVAKDQQVQTVPFVGNELMDSVSEDKNSKIPQDKQLPLTQSIISANDNNQLGIIRFNDYSENKSGLNSFWANLSNIKTLNRPVRIAFFGDSFIEGDILSGDLRHLFQENFGGKGVGMMPVTSQVTGFRKTIIHQFSAWNTRSFDNFDKAKLGIAGSTFIPNNNAWVYYQGVKKNFLDTCRRVSIFYSLPDNETRVFYKKNKGTSLYASLPKAENVGRVDINGNCGNIQISFPQLNNLHVYGVSLEDTTGVILDNYSIRGFSGTGLQNLSGEKLAQFNKLRQYDLIILGFGLNVTEAKRTEYKAYEAEMIKAVNHLKSSFPNASILLVGVPDRSYKDKGEYETMPGILAMIEHQKNICQKTGIVFWNLFEAMGGKNSMPLFVDSNPPKANKDYTHLTFSGGEYLGNLLYETFMYEKGVYEKRYLQAMVK